MLHAGKICARLHSVPLRSCRADLVIRRALIADEVASLGVTAYLTAAGLDEPAAANGTGRGTGCLRGSLQELRSAPESRRFKVTMRKARASSSIG